jgi:hypothetical protein
MNPTRKSIQYDEKQQLLSNDNQRMESSSSNVMMITVEGLQLLHALHEQGSCIVSSCFDYKAIHLKK